FLAEHDLVAAFGAGWRLVYENVSRRVADRLIATLVDVRHLDSEIARDSTVYGLLLDFLRGRFGHTPRRSAWKGLSPTILGVEMPSHEETITRLESEVGDALTRCDTEVLARLFADDFIGVNPMGMETTKAEVLAQIGSSDYQPRVFLKGSPSPR